MDFRNLIVEIRQENAIRIVDNVVVNRQIVKVKIIGVNLVMNLDNLYVGKVEEAGNLSVSIVHYYDYKTMPSYY